MSKPRVFVTRIIPEEGLEMVRSVSEAEVWQGKLPPPYEVLVQKIASVDGLLCLLTDKIDSDLIAAAGESLKVISQMAVGYDNIDVPAATERGIPVGNTPGVLTDATADFAWALLMAAARRVVEADKFTRDGRWKTWGPTLLLGPDIAGATLGIVGLGRIGQAVVKRAKGFGMRIIYHDTQRRPEIEETMGVEFAAFDSLLQESDFVSIHTVLSDETHHLFGEKQFDLMKPSGILINTARGPIVDSIALHSALLKGKIAYAALDVTEAEPIRADDPLLELENIIITPHIASASMQARTKMATMAAANLIAGLKGENLPNCVNAEVFSRST
ncbi:MAG: D-glycerate dehydrogenase [Anaerolineales bacterium]|nr:D-glycerate dehydrogenase [Anaerolineales bacterium]MCK5633832.1 D-glycerate dehydrogenase [Anaerolineales bacterium]